MQRDFRNRNDSNRGDYKKRPFRAKRHRREEFFLPGNGLGVKVPDGEQMTLEKALKYFKRQLKDSEKMFELKLRKYYEKPSAKRTRVLDEAKRNQWTANKQQERADKYVWTAIINGKAM